VAIQDMGAAGLTSSSAEMAARGDVGVTIDTLKVPAREEGMTPYELLLSESQERMLVVAKQGHEAQVIEILAKWDLTAAVIGEVIAEPVYRVTEGERVVAEFPGIRLVTDCPTYEPEARESDEIARLRAVDVHATPERPDEADPLWTLTQLLASPTIASKRWVHRQYDTMVRTNTVIGPGGDAAVVRLRGTDKALALKTDCNGRYCYLDPYVGGMQAVAESARNVACAGGEPKAITNNLNFGNPKRPEVYFQLREAVRGMGEACRALQTPVTGGNVSLYNENPNGAIYPTPVVGMVGLVESLAHVTRAGFQRPGDTVVLLGENTDELGASEYLARVHGLVAGAPPHVDLDASGAWWLRCSTRFAPERWPRRTTAATAASRSRWPSARSATRSGGWEPRSTSRPGTRCRVAHCSSARRRRASSSRAPMRTRCWRPRLVTACRRASSARCATPGGAHAAHPRQHMDGRIGDARGCVSRGDPTPDGSCGDGGRRS
jgi:phosphoribosylformylglycinamidine synthase